jgi:hypothetical protein
MKVLEKGFFHSSSKIVRTILSITNLHCRGSKNVLFDEKRIVVTHPFTNQEHMYKIRKFILQKSESYYFITKSWKQILRNQKFKFYVFSNQELN